MNTPNAFLLVSGSFRMIAANTIVIIGVVVATTVASIGVVYDKPMIKQFWLKVIESKDAINRSKRSRGGTFSLGTKREAIQKAMAAPITRMAARENPEISPDKNAIFEMGDINPQITLAVNIATCPPALYLFILLPIEYHLCDCERTCI